MLLLNVGVATLLAVAPQTASIGNQCADPGLMPSMREFCLGEEESTRKAFDAAAKHFRRAADTSTADLKVRALFALQETYGRGRLNDPAQREIVLRELIALVPADPQYSFQLAALQESEGFPEAAEETLLGVRRQLPQEPEVFRRLAQFYARRIAALNPPSSAAREPIAPGERDADGVYRIGGQLPPPARAGIPEYPSAAKDAAIQGAVQAEIVVDEQGQVADARIVRSVPLLDEAALEAVRKWRFEPTVVEGRPVPVRMVVTVNFSLPN